MPCRACSAAVAAAGPDDPRAQELDRRVMVGLVGYPNVGKSSTINALFGSKKTAVAPTPGKTKHFQTLNISSTLCLCDCPGGRCVGGGVEGGGAAADAVAAQPQTSSNQAVTWAWAVGSLLWALLVHATDCLVDV